MRKNYRTLALVWVIVAACGCGSSGSASRPVCNQSSFDAALRDAIDPSEDRISHHLLAITPSNPVLTWDSTHSSVLMVQWTRFTGYSLGPNVLGVDAFVSATPQVRDFCNQFAAPDRPQRIDEYLGLPPEGAAASQRRIVEMWVKPADLFRPCADPAIDTDSCGLDFPPGVSQQHRDWLSNWFSTALGSWQKSKFPFTSLGYTYDWCNPTSREGASEIVARKGSTVTVEAISDTAAYCAASGSP